jgi:hypothetical protein
MSQCDCVCCDCMAVHADKQRDMAEKLSTAFGHGRKPRAQGLVAVINLVETLRGFFLRCDCIHSAQHSGVAAWCAPLRPLPSRPHATSRLCPSCHHHAHQARKWTCGQIERGQAEGEEALHKPWCHKTEWPSACQSCSCQQQTCEEEACASGRSCLRADSNSLPASGSDPAFHHHARSRRCASDSATDEWRRYSGRATHTRVNL